MRCSIALVSLLAASAAYLPSVAFGYGEPDQGYPSVEERQMLVLINRVRAEPNNVAVGNAAECSTPHDPVPPVAYDANIGRAARFHCVHLTLNGGGLSHDSFCDVVPDIATNGCDGSADCSCQQGTECWNCDTLGGCGTSPGERAALFGHAGGVSEVGAAGYGALGAHSGWATECPSAEGHRNTLTNGSLAIVGTGYAQGGSCWGNYEFADFAGGDAPPRIASAADINGTIEANYYDPAGDPTSIDAVVDGTCHPMTVFVGTVAGNRDYTVSYTPTGGCQQFYIVAKDVGGVVTRYPTVGSLTINCDEDYVATQIDAACSACNEGETRPCSNGTCDGTQPCVDGEWGACDAPASCGSGGSGTGGTGTGGSGTGANATGGSGTGVVGGAPAAGTDASDADEGCGCRTRRSPGSRGVAPALVGLVAAGVALRRVRARRRVANAPLG